MRKGAIQPTIFIVEDNEIYTMMLDQKLSELLTNYNLRTFRSGEECIENLNLDPDIIVLDYYLPGKDGLETLRQIKTIKAETPVIILSHQKDIHIALELLEAGAYDYIIKDKDSYLRVKNAISNILGSRQLETENITLKVKVNKFLFIMVLSILLMLALLISFISVILSNFKQ